MVVDFVPAQFFFELCQLRVIIYQKIFDPGHTCKVLEVLCGENLTEAGVVGSSGQNPRSCGDFQIRFGYPNDSRHR